MIRVDVLGAGAGETFLIETDCAGVGQPLTDTGKWRCFQRDGTEDDGSDLAIGRASCIAANSPCVGAGSRILTIGTGQFTTPIANRRAAVVYVESPFDTKQALTRVSINACVAGAGNSTGGNMTGPMIMCQWPDGPGFYAFVVSRNATTYSVARLIEQTSAGVINDLTGTFSIGAGSGLRELIVTWDGARVRAIVNGTVLAQSLTTDVFSTGRPGWAARPVAGISSTGEDYVQAAGLNESITGKPGGFRQIYL